MNNNISYTWLSGNTQDLGLVTFKNLKQSSLFHTFSYPFKQSLNKSYGLCYQQKKVLWILKIDTNDSS